MERLPNLIIIGAQKCGTSSLHYYLSLHPEVFMSHHKELNFFNEECNWGKGLDWYKSNFPVKEGVKIYGESFPRYTIYPKFKGVSERMYKIIPQAKLIYLVRNPVERLLSQYTDRVRGRLEERSFEEVFNKELVTSGESDYIWISKYYMQLKQFLKYYSPTQILIVNVEDLKNERVSVLKKVFEFLGISKDFSCPQFFEEKNVSGRKRKRGVLKIPRHYLLRKYEKNKFFGKLLNLLTFNFIKKRIEQINQNQEKVEKPVLTRKDYDKLITIFRSDIKKIEEFSGCDFSAWFNYADKNNGKELLKERLRSLGYIS